MAKELNVDARALRRYMSKLGIATGRQQEFRAMQRYFTATSLKEKAKAFEEVDKYLQEIVQERFKQSKGMTYEDCLQDVRLRFSELLFKRETVGYRGNIIVRLSGIMPASKEEIEIVGLDALKREKVNLSAADSQIEKFEIEDYGKSVKNILRAVKEMCLSII